MRPMTYLAVAISLCLPRAAVAQDVKTDIYLMQIAAAVSGSSAGGPVVVVICDSAGTYNVIGTYPTQAQAAEAVRPARAQGKQCAVEGPYVAGPVYEARIGTYGSGGCKKLPDSDCVADSTRVFAIDDIMDVTLTYRLRNGRVVLDTFRPRDVEAVFFTMPAIERMLIPYYVKIRGFTYAANKRREFLRLYRARDVSSP